MTEPGGSPGSGWDVRLDLGSVGRPLAGPSGNASPTGDAAGTHARRKSGDFAGTSPRADGAASGSSGSPDENVSARSNPPSPRDRSPRSRSPRPPSPSDEDDPHRAQQHSTPSPVARRSVTPLPFEQRRRDALAAKQRRLDGMMGKLSAVRTGREASPAGSVGSAESDDTHDGDDDAVDRPSPRPPNLGEPSRHPLDTEQDERLLARRASPVGSPVAKPPRADEDAVSPTLTDGSASVSDDWDDLLADARRDVFSSPPPKQIQNTRTPTSAASLATSATASPWPTVSPALPEPSARGRAPTRNPPVSEKEKETSLSSPEKETSSTSSPSLPFRTRALRIETPSSRPSSRDDESIFGTPAGETPNASAVVGEGLARSPLGARRPETREFGFDRDVAFEPASPSASPATSFATPRATDAAAIGGVFASDHLNENAAEAEAEAVRRRAGKPALSDGAASFLARLGAARRGDAAHRARFRRAFGVPDEPTRDGASIRIRGVSDPWLADAANAAAEAHAREDASTPRTPPRVSSAGEPSSPGFVPDTPRTPTGASLSSPGTPGPGTPGDARMRPPPRGKAFDIPKQPATATLGKAAAARRIMMAASPAKGSPGSTRSASSPGGAVSGVLFGPPPAFGSSAPSSSSPGSSPSTRKQAAARRIMLAAAAKKASEGVEEDAATLKVVGASIRGGENVGAVTDASVEPATVETTFADARVPATKPVAARGLSMELGAAEGEEVSTEPIDADPREVPEGAVDAEGTSSVERRVERVESGVSSSPAVASSSTFLTDASSEFAFDAPATTGPATTGLDPSRATRGGRGDHPRDGRGDHRAPIDPELKPGPMSPTLPNPPLPNPRGFVSDVSDSEFDKTDASDWETEEQFSRADARLEAAHDTDAGGYGTAGETFANDDPRAFHTRRALLAALSRAETRLEEKEWEREAMATRLAEAESALSRVESIDSARFAQLQAEAEQNGYLRRLLKRAEETRSEARARAKSAGQALVARDAELERSRRRYERDVSRADAETKGLKRRVAAERARGGALETALAEANAELAAAHRRHLGTFQTLGVALAALVALAMRVYFGPRIGPDGTGGGYGNGSSVGFMPRV